MRQSDVIGSAESCGQLAVNPEKRALRGLAMWQGESNETLRQKDDFSARRTTDRNGFARIDEAPGSRPQAQIVGHLVRAELRQPSVDPSAKRACPLLGFRLRNWKLQDRLPLQ